MPHFTTLLIFFWSNSVIERNKDAITPEQMPITHCRPPHHDAPRFFVDFRQIEATLKGSAAQLGHVHVCPESPPWTVHRSIQPSFS